ncbi:PREDICTED: uncharacterized protein LOC108444936 [Corvus brachyrhynchos]|uniref:uncharacterized protein LOC108444936 n=1 Tax=Corvus brachyrhynchos TaxID=85066 RepID=UPI000816709E|nr:PREDICTED: uncharacterized protein LOC108444936 [Corvus brachyrhynchos]
MGSSLPDPWHSPRGSPHPFPPSPRGLCLLSAPSFQLLLPDFCPPASLSQEFCRCRFRAGSGGSAAVPEHPVRAWGAIKGLGMDWERREFARTAPAAAPRRSPDGETLPALSVLHLPEGELQRRWIYADFCSRFFPPLPRSNSQPRLLPAPLAARRGVGGRKGMLGGFGKRGSCGAFPAMLHLRSARRLRSSAGVGAKAPKSGCSRPLFRWDAGERRILFPEVSLVDVSVPLRTGWGCLTCSWWHGGVGRRDFWGCGDHPGSVPFPNGRRFGFRTAHALALGISTLEQQDFQILERREMGMEGKEAPML